MCLILMLLFWPKKFTVWKKSYRNCFFVVAWPTLKLVGRSCICIMLVLDALMMMVVVVDGVVVVVAVVVGFRTVLVLMVVVTVVVGVLVIMERPDIFS